MNSQAKKQNAPRTSTTNFEFCTGNVISHSCLFGLVVRGKFLPAAKERVELPPYTEDMLSVIAINQRLGGPLILHTCGLEMEMLLT